MVSESGNSFVEHNKYGLFLQPHQSSVQIVEALPGYFGWRTPCITFSEYDFSTLERSNHLSQNACIKLKKCLNEVPCFNFSLKNKHGCWIKDFLEDIRCHSSLFVCPWWKQAEVFSLFFVNSSQIRTKKMIQKCK